MPPPPGRRVHYFHDENIGVHASVEASQRKPHSVRLTDELIQAYGLYAHMTVCTYGKFWGALSEQEIGKFHTDAYLQFLQQIEYNSHEIIDEAASFVLNNSVCFSETAWPYSQIYAGGSVAAASSLTRGQADVAINWIGGQTHARQDCASGFSYVNDVVLAVLALLPAYERVLFVNIDACHSSGVEEAFFTTDRVMCISLHCKRPGFFPGSGGVKDTGQEAGNYHNINLPVREGFCDNDIEALFLPVLQAAAGKYQPHVVVCCAGTNVLAGDRLAGLNMTIDGYKRCIRALMDIGRPILLLGSSGHSLPSSARAWCSFTAMACEVPIPNEIPRHDWYNYYAPTFRLGVPTVAMDNANTPASLAATRQAALATIDKMYQRAPVPKIAAARNAAAAAAAPRVAGKAPNAAVGACGVGCAACSCGAAYASEQQQQQHQQPQPQQPLSQPQQLAPQHAPAPQAPVAHAPAPHAVRIDPREPFEARMRQHMMDMDRSVYSFKGQAAARPGEQLRAPMGFASAAGGGGMPHVPREAMDVEARPSS